MRPPTRRTPQPAHRRDSQLQSAIQADWKANVGNPKARLILLLFRVANRCERWRSPVLRPLRIVIGIVYRVLVEWILGVEIPWKTKVGPGLRIYHGVGIVINDHATIGADVTIRHAVTIGHRAPGDASPNIGNGVDIGAGAIILGPIYIGDYARVGAGAIVVNDVPANGVAISAAATVRPPRV